MKKLLLALLLSTIASGAWAQCSGPFANQSVCGNATGASTTPRPTPMSSFAPSLFANPTAQVGLTAVNGVATTGIRSDGAPALSQAIVPTWTGLHTFNTLPAVFGTSGYAWIGNGVSAATFQGYTNSGASAVTRTWQSKDDDTTSVKDFGADSTGVATSTAALNLATATARTINFPQGTYNLATAPNYGSRAPLHVDASTAFSGSSVYGMSATMQSTAQALSAATTISVADTSTLQNGLLITAQQITGTSGSISTSACIPNATTITVTNATTITLSAALTCTLPSGTWLYFQGVNPIYYKGPFFHEYNSVADSSLRSNFRNELRSLTPLLIQQVTNFANGTGNQAPSLQIREVHAGDQSISYGSCGAGGCTGPTATFGAVGGQSFTQILRGDGFINMFNIAQSATGTPKQGYQGMTFLQGTQNCNASSLHCQLRVQEIVQEDNAVAAQMVGNIVRMNISSTAPGMQRTAFMGSCGRSGGGEPCGELLLAGGFAASTAATWLQGINFAAPLVSGTSLFSTGNWALVSNGDYVASAQRGAGSLQYVYIVGPAAGTGCGSPGTHVALTVSGGGGAGGAANGIISNSGSVMNVYITNPGSGYTSAPTVSLAGCSVAPTFGVYLNYVTKIFGTTSAGITEIYGGDTNASLVPLGTIRLMNANTGNIMLRLVGSTGGGLQVYNGATQPTGGDKGAGTINAATGIYVNNVAVPTVVASGTKALATSAIGSATCTSAQTSTATGTLTTDTINATFNADPTGVTGYSPSIAGMLTIMAYPTADTVNFKVCNNTNASITPGAITLNWRVSR